MLWIIFKLWENGNDFVSLLAFAENDLVAVFTSQNPIAIAVVLVHLIALAVHSRFIAVACKITT